MMQNNDHSQSGLGHECMNAQTPVQIPAHDMMAQAQAAQTIAIDDEDNNKDNEDKDAPINDENTAPVISPSPMPPFRNLRGVQRDGMHINEPFGGIQIVAFGDFFQLSPIVCGDTYCDHDEARPF